MTHLEIIQKIAAQVFKDQSYLIGAFTKPTAPGLVINHWAGVSLSDPTFLHFIASEMAKVIEENGGTDLICGIETAGISLAAAISQASGKPWIYARKARKAYGSQEAFEGTYSAGQKVVFVDNLSAKGKGMPPIFANAKETGFTFHELVAIVDVGWTKIDAFEEYDVAVHSLITTRELTDALNDMGYFPGNLYNFIVAQLENPAEWSEDSAIVKEFQAELAAVEDRPYIRKSL